APARRRRPEQADAGQAVAEARRGPPACRRRRGPGRRPRARLEPRRPPAGPRRRRPRRGGHEALGARRPAGRAAPGAGAARAGRPDRGRRFVHGSAGTFSPMATVRPFRALRFDEGVAGPLAKLVAPPYDVITPERRAAYLARSPSNVVHLTLPDSEEQAARDLADWREWGVLAQEPEPSYRWLSQDYVGPGGVARPREGFAAALPVEPHARRGIQPDERTHPGPYPRPPR